MALSITSTANTIAVDFGNPPAGEIKKGSWVKANIIQFTLRDEWIDIVVSGAGFQVSNNAVNGCLVVDSVNGVAPTSLDDLFSKLIALLG